MRRFPRTCTLLALLFVLGAAVWGWMSWREHVLARNHRFAYQARFILVGAQQTYIHERRGPAPFGTGDAAGLFPLGLIDRALAEADDRPLKPLVPKPIPVNGYLVRFLSTASGAHFGYCLYPAEPGVTGKYIFILSDYGRFGRCGVGERPVPTVWPSDEEIRYWTNDCGG